MSVTVEHGLIRLTGRCGPEDAEAVLVALQEGRDRTVDLDGVEKLHTAVAQVLLAVRPPVHGTPEDAFLANHLAILLQ
jgi:hypothetical protein